MDIRGGGQDADMERVTREDGYGSDNEVDSRNDASWSAQRVSTASKPLMNRSIAAIQSQVSCFPSASFYQNAVSPGFLKPVFMMSPFMSLTLSRSPPIIEKRPLCQGVAISKVLAS